MYPLFVVQLPRLIGSDGSAEVIGTEAVSMKLEEIDDDIKDKGYKVHFFLHVVTLLNNNHNKELTSTHCLQIVVLYVQLLVRL